MTGVTLYRYDDSSGITLYVGITERGQLRGREHEVKPWWSLVASAQFVHFTTRREALAAESDMIRLYRPIYNVQHNADVSQLRTAYATIRESMPVVVFERVDATTLSADAAPLNEGMLQHLVVKLGSCPRRLRVAHTEAVSIHHEGSVVVVVTKSPIPVGQYQMRFALNSAGFYYATGIERATVLETRAASGT